MCGISNWNAYPLLQKTGDDTDDNVDPTEGDVCTDGNANCPAWAKAGECSANYQYMLENCSKSCGVCGCADGSTDCAGWANAGYCTASKCQEGRGGHLWLLYNK